MSSAEQSVTTTGATEASPPSPSSQPVPRPMTLPAPELTRVEKALVHVYKICEESWPSITPLPHAIDTAGLFETFETTAGSDRRTYPRRESVCIVSVRRDSTDASLSQHRADWMLHSSRLKGKLLNISMNGVAFVLNESMQRDEGLLLRLTNRRFDKSIDATATILRCSRYGTGEWKIVCRFRKTLTFEQIRLFGQQLESTRLI